MPELEFVGEVNGIAVNPRQEIALTYLRIRSPRITNSDFQALCPEVHAETIRAGLVTVKSVLAENYVRPDEAEKVKSKIRERGSFKVIDKVTVKLNENRDAYEALLSNLGIKNAEVPDSYVRQFEKLRVGGIWCIVTLNYRFEENQRTSPFVVSDRKPIQIAVASDTDNTKSIARAAFADLHFVARQQNCS